MNGRRKMRRLQRVGVHDTRLDLPSNRPTEALWFLDPEQRKDAPVSQTTVYDVLLYAWASVLILIFALAVPPIALLWAAFPLWHRRRMFRRRMRRLASHGRARLNWLERL
jgi:hypothetical protein